MNGGNMIPVIPPVDALDPRFIGLSGTGQAVAGHSSVQIFQVKGVGTDDVAGSETANDIVLSVNYLNPETCIALNDLLGVVNPGGNPPTAAYTGVGPFYGGNLTNFSLATIIMDVASNNGQPAFCRRNGTTYYQFVLTLVER